MMYGSQDMEHNRQNIWTIFALLTPNNLKNKNFQKMKKTPGGIIISHMCAINDDHMMYGFWLS